MRPIEERRRDSHRGRAATNVDELVVATDDLAMKPLELREPPPLVVLETVTPVPPPAPAASVRLLRDAVESVDLPSTEDLSRDLSPGRPREVLPHTVRVLGVVALILLCLVIGFVLGTCD